MSLKVGMVTIGQSSRVDVIPEDILGACRQLIRNGLNLVYKPGR